MGDGGVGWVRSVVLDERCQWCWMGDGGGVGWMMMTMMM